MKLLSTLAGLLLALNAAQAAPVVYADVDNSFLPALASRPNTQAAQAAFTAALAGSNIAVQDYESATLGLLGPVTTGVLSNGVGVTVNNTTVNGRLEVVAPSGGVDTVFSTFATSGGSYLLALSDKDSTYFTVSFSQAVSGIGFYVSDVSDWAACSPSPLCAVVPPLDVLLTTQSGASLQYSLTPGTDPLTLVNGNLGFFGVVDAADPFTSIAIRSVGTPDADALGIDNFTVAVPSVSAAIPEPSSALLMLGLLPVWVWSRRRLVR